nr:hypothetical protein [Mycoplasmopsis bovis]
MVKRVYADGLEFDFNLCDRRKTHNAYPDKEIVKLLKRSAKKKKNKCFDVFLPTDVFYSIRFFRRNDK